MAAFRRSAVRERSSLMTSDGQEPTRNSWRMSGRRERRRSTSRSQLLMSVGETGEVLLFENRGAESGFGEDHHPGGGLQEMGAGAAAHDEEEGVLHLAVQPDDPRQAAETPHAGRVRAGRGCGGSRW